MKADREIDYSFSVKDRAYYFFRNLYAFLLCVLVLPFYMTHIVVYNLIIVFTKTDGSVILGYPWEWEWPGR